MALDQLYQFIEEKESQLCIGLDPRVTPNERLDWALDLITATAEYAVAFKPNRQFWLGTSFEEMEKLTAAIHDNNAIAIMDHKLSDIGSSNRSTMKWTAKEGFDYITVSPFPGNLEQVCKIGKENNIGIIGLVLMSNPEAEYMTKLDYVSWAEICNKFNGGIVVGTTNHVTESHISKIAKTFSDGFILAPGLGKQGGRVDIILKYFGKRALFNVSRGISQADDPKIAAEKYHEMINQLRSQ